MKKSKLFSALTAVILVLSMILVACTGGSDGGTQETPDTGSTQTTTPDTGTTTPADTQDPDDDDDSFAGYPMDAMDVTLSFMLWGGPQLHPSIAEWEDSPFHTGLIRHVGVNIDWMFPPAGAGDEVQGFNLMVASGDYPDIIFSGSLMNDAERLIDERVLLDLSPYIRDFAPNYFSFLQENLARDRAFRTDSGRYFGFGFFREDAGNDTFQGPLVRKDLLDELSLPLPVTISDWDRTLRAFNDEYGVTFLSPWARFNGSGNIAGAFGAYGGTQYIVHIDPADNKVKVAQTAPQWRDYMEQMSIWWADGLIDQDLLTSDDGSIRAKTANNEGGLAYSSMGQLSGWLLDAEELGLTTDWIGLDYPQGDDGTKTFVFGGSGIGQHLAAITTSVGEDRIEYAMRLLDYAYTPEGSLYWNFGEEGVAWNWEGGVPTFSQLLHDDPDGIHGAMEKYAGSVWSGPVVQATEMLAQRNSPISMGAMRLWGIGNQDVTSNFGLPRGMALSADESAKAESIESAISTYVNEMASRFLTGQEPISNFDSFVSTVESMGLEELLSLYQAAYDRYLARN